MTYRILYHPLVLDGLESIPSNFQQRIENAISSRLQNAPESYGKPLAGNLAGHWKLRVGDCRIVFKLKKAEVIILAVIHRKNVYTRISSRLKWFPAGS